MLPRAFLRSIVNIESLYWIGLANILFEREDKSRGNSHHHHHHSYILQPFRVDNKCLHILHITNILFADMESA